ncbi:unnamed protein product [Prorocentrum cordatum]|uniref:Uncharacterized protein n=1 Tax=Prorocentrum cordatum TaxID=2364126 RepID=A0ABN9YD94_9DINO|nr:unnamed protein product [Polarella glacialis]
MSLRTFTQEGKTHTDTMLANMENPFICVYLFVCPGAPLRRRCEWDAALGLAEKVSDECAEADSTRSDAEPARRCAEQRRAPGAQMDCMSADLLMLWGGRPARPTPSPSSRVGKAIFPRAALAASSNTLPRVRALPSSRPSYSTSFDVGVHVATQIGERFDT